jgi:hypothetical protein
MERVVLADRPLEWSPGPHLPAAYTQQVFSQPQRLAFILQQLQQGLEAHQRAAVEGQAARLAKDHGGDVQALTDQLQELQVGASSSVGSSSTTTSSTTSSAAGGVPPVTPGDITVAANALLVACKAAGALCGVPQLLERFNGALEKNQMRVWGEQPLGGLREVYCDLSGGMVSAVQNIAEWAVLIHPVLVQLLPVEQGQVLVGLSDCLTEPSSSSSSSGSETAQGKLTGSTKRLSAEEVAAVLGALQHVVIPGQPGCSNPRCCCLEGVSEADVKTQVCGGCRGVRYCSAACQKAHWKAGHKEVCKAAQAAAKAALSTEGGISQAC